MSELTEEEEGILELIADDESGYGTILSYAAEHDIEADNTVNQLEEDGYIVTDGGVNLDLASRGRKYLGTDEEVQESDKFDNLDDRYKYALAIASTSLGLEEVSNHHDKDPEIVKGWLEDAEKQDLVHRPGLNYKIKGKAHDIIGSTATGNGSVDYNSDYWDSLVDEIEERKKEESEESPERVTADYIKNLLEENDQILLSQISRELERPEEKIESEVREIANSGSISLVSQAGVTFIESR